MFPLDLSVKIIQVFDEFFFLSIFTKHGGHLFAQSRNYIRMDFGQSGTLDEVVELKSRRFALIQCTVCPHAYIAKIQDFGFRHFYGKFMCF